MICNFCSREIVDVNTQIETDIEIGDYIFDDFKNRSYYHSWCWEEKRLGVLVRNLER